jgi:hypothetical protein
MVGGGLSPPGLWSLPGPTRFLASIRADVRAGKQVAAVLPHHGVADGFLDTAERALSEVRRVEVLRLGSEDLARADRLLEDLLARHRIPPPADGSPPSARHLLTDGYRTSGLTIIVDLTRVHPDDLGRWNRNLEHHAAYMKSLRDTERVGLVVACREGHVEQLPNPDVNVTHHWWWGVLQRLDVLIWSLDRRPVGPDGEVKANMIVELGAFDLELSSHLLTHWNGDFATADETLQRYGRTSGVRDLLASHRDDFALDIGRVVRGHAVPQGLRAAWDAGLVEMWEGVPSWHRSLLAELAGQRPDAARELTRLVWRAQVATLLPSVEFARHAIARSVSERRDGLREGSRFRSTCRDAKDVEMLEYADLKNYLKDLRGSARRNDLERSLESLRVYRNRLAHVDPLGAEGIRDLISVIQEARTAAR